MHTVEAVVHNVHTCAIGWVQELLYAHLIRCVANDNHSYLPVCGHIKEAAKEILL